MWESPKMRAGLISEHQIRQCKQLAEELEKTQIPNKDRLIQKLRGGPTPGHYAHAELVKRFHEDGTYQVTDVENTDEGYDVDIELDQNINVQVWHGASCAAHKGDRDERDELGGVRDCWEKNESVLRKKLAQLPNDKLGMLLLLQASTGLNFLPEWYRDIIPSSKCVIELRTESSEPLAGEHSAATIHRNIDFKNGDEAKKVISAIGYEYRGICTFDDGLKCIQE